MIEIEPARRDDADALAAVFTASRQAAMPWLPKLHDEDDDRHFIAERVMGECELLVVRRDGRPIAFLALKDDMVEHLYVRPDDQRAGIGSALIEAAKARSPTGLRLWVFQRNHGARAFYARHGFAEVRRTDGAGNEEREPDVLLAWTVVRSRQVDPSLLVLQHIACEPPAAFEDELRSRGLDLVRVELDEGEQLPDWREFPAIVVMGGPMGAYEDAEHPWLTGEKRLLREAVEADVPVWGVCLGAQLLAAALGARVYRGERPEVGLLPVELAPAASGDPVFGDLPSSFPTLQWHGDTFDLPAGATLLASSPAYPNQAFRVGRSYGLQFHIEVPLELATEWGEVPAYADSLESTLGPGGLDRLLAGVAEHQDVTVPLARELFGRWLEHVVRDDLPRAEQRSHRAAT